jgi:carboxyl-terminal processing protease
MRNRNLFFGLVFAFGFIYLLRFQLGDDGDYFFKMNKSIDIFGKVYKEVILNYVDRVDPEKFMRAGIKGMLDALDPYTVFIDEKHSNDVDMLTTGKYGGIGISISKFDDEITIVKVVRGYPADRAGLKVGDVIIEVDSVSVIGKSLDDVRALMLGKPGTPIYLKIKRYGIENPLEFRLKREEIELRNISYYGFIDEGIAYVKLNRFSRRAGEELRKAIRELISRGKISGFILDLRGNPGGLLDAAVDVAEKFLPRGSLIVSTRGRKPDAVKRYYSSENPILPDVPLCVLVDGASASASEIVAGAIQDLDRGIIVGRKTFGKGLVQTISYLSYNTFLKITTAKYYTPSGRSIQAVDYFHRPDGVFIIEPDSVPKVFKTKNGRTVYARGGIMPDSVVDGATHSDFFNALRKERMFFKFASYFMSRHKTLPENFRVDEDLLNEFKKFIKENNFTYRDSLEINISRAIAYAKKHGYRDDYISELEKLLERVRVERDGLFKLYKDEISRQLEIEILSRYKYEPEVIEYTLRFDKQVKVASSILKNRKIYNSLLGLN